MSLLASPLEGEYDRYLSARSTLVYLLKVAASQGVLDRQAGPRTAAEIATASGGDPGRISLLCSTLLSYGILEQQGDKFAISQKFFKLFPSGSNAELTKLLEHEEHRIRVMEATTDAARRKLGELPPDFMVAQLRAAAAAAGDVSVAEAAPSDSGPNGARAVQQPTGPSTSPQSNGSAAAEGASAMERQTIKIPASGEPASPADASSLSSAAGVVALRDAGVETAGPGFRAKVRTPAVPIPARRKYSSPVTPASVASAFAGGWPIGILGISAIERVVRTTAMPRPGRVRRLRRRIGTLLWLGAAICVAWAVWDLWGTGLSQADAQEELRAQFTRALAEPRQADTPAVPDSVPGDAPPPVAFTEPPPKPLPGAAIAVLKIPAINLEQTILEGTDVADLRRGPGHYPSTVLPGQPGNAAIAGHRTTYGAPFYKLGKLQVGDAMEVTTTRGSFTYRVIRVYRVDPDDSSPLLPSTANLLTLTTCDPPFSAAKRLIVVGVLEGSPDVVPPTVAPKADPVPSPPPPAPQETVAPGLNLRAIRQPGPAASPSPGARNNRSAAAPGEANPNPAPAPAAEAPAATQPPQATTTTQPTASQVNPDELNPFLRPQPQEPPPTLATTIPNQQQQPNNAGLPECSDGIDNDGDDDVDLADRSCRGDPNDDE